MVAFCEGWKKLYGASYTPGAAEFANLKTMLASLPEADRHDVPRWIENYLSSHTKFLVEEVRHGLGFFVTNGNWNRFRVKAKVAKTVAEKNALFFARALSKAGGEQ